MAHWINDASETENVVVATEKGLHVGSSDKEHRLEVGRRLDAGEAPAEVLGTEGLKIIPLEQIQSLTVRSTDDSVDLSFRANRRVEQETLFFETAEAAAAFAAHLAPLLPEALERRVYTQSVVVTAFRPATC